MEEWNHEKRVYMPAKQTSGSAEIAARMSRSPPQASLRERLDSLLREMPGESCTKTRPSNPEGRTPGKH
jgi:hypothetical protein